MNTAIIVIIAVIAALLVLDFIAFLNKSIKTANEKYELYSAEFNRPDITVKKVSKPRAFLQYIKISFMSSWFPYNNPSVLANNPEIKNEEYYDLFDEYDEALKEKLADLYDENGDEDMVFYFDTAEEADLAERCSEACDYVIKNYRKYIKQLHRWYGPLINSYDLWEASVIGIQDFQQTIDGILEHSIRPIN